MLSKNFVQLDLEKSGKIQIFHSLKKKNQNVSDFNKSINFKCFFTLRNQIHEFLVRWRCCVLGVKSIYLWSIDRRKLHKRQLSSLVTINDNLDAMYCTLRRRPTEVKITSPHFPSLDDPHRVRKVVKSSGKSSESDEEDLEEEVKSTKLPSKDLVQTHRTEHVSSVVKNNVETDYNTSGMYWLYEKKRQTYVKF